MLAWPSFALLKQSCECEVTVLVPKYTDELAQLCPWIDKTIIDPGKNAIKSAQDLCLQQIKDGQFDAVITLFSTTRVGWWIWQSKIPYRLAPATKLAQIFYNHRVPQRRSQSLKPEYQYNIDLVLRFLNDNSITPVLHAAPYLVFSQTELSDIRDELATAFKISNDYPMVMVHCGSGGSANNLSITQYADLISLIDSRSGRPLNIILTAGPGEEHKTQELASLLRTKSIDAHVFVSQNGLTHFAKVLANASMFIAGSTGPLHMASALDVPTVGFFPQRRSATPLRWRPLNSEGRHLAFSPPKGNASEQDMSLIDIDHAADEIVDWFQKLES